MTADLPVRLGVLGCADIAWRKALPAVTAEPGLQLVAVASRDRAKADRFARRFGCEAVSGYLNLLDRDDIDAVYIPLPAGLHHRWARTALSANKHVLVEKPIATTEKEVVDLVEQASSRDLVLMENIAFLLHGQHRTVQEIRAAGELGELRMLTSAFGVPRLPPDDIRYRADLGGGALLDVGFYPLRAALRFLGPELRLVGADLRYDESGVDVAGTALVAAPDGLTGHLSFGIDHFYRSEYELWGSAGRLTLRRAFTPPETYQPLVRIERNQLVETRTLAADDQLAALARTFASAIAGRFDLRRHHDEIVLQARLVETIRLHARAAAGSLCPTTGGARSHE